MKLPGTVPPNVQKVYSTPSASLPTFSMTSSSTTTFAACVRKIGGGTFGGDVSVARSTGSPWAWALAVSHHTASANHRAVVLMILMLISLFLRIMIGPYGMASAVGMSC